MKSILVYDSLYGNTREIALAIHAALNEHVESTLLHVNEITLDQLAGIDILIVGSPTQRFKPTDALVKFLSSIPSAGLKGVRIAAFDTRLTSAEIEKSPPLPIFVKMFGFAAGRIAKKLRSKGGQQLVLPEGFYVYGMQGPLVEGELARAADWARTLFA